MRDRHGLETELEERSRKRRSLGDKAADRGVSGAADLVTVACSSYEIAFARVYGRLGAAARELQRARQRAPVLYDELLKHPQGRRLLLVRNSQRYHSWGLADLLLTRVRQRWEDDPAAAQDLAELALAVAQNLDERETGRLVLNDLLTRAWAYLGNARRMTSDLPGAQRALERAERRLHRGSGDPLERAEILELKAALYRDLSRFDRAIEALTRAMGAYRRANERHLAGKALIKKAVIYQQWTQPEKGIPLLRRAAGLIDAEKDPRLLLSLQQMLVTCLDESGHPRQARALLPGLRRLTLEQGNHRDLLLVRRLEGLVATRLGNDAYAEAWLVKARNGFLERGIPYDAARVSLDLASLYLRQGRTREVRTLSGELLALFKAQRARREVLAAITLFVEAAELETLTPGTIQRVAHALQRAQEPAPHLFDAPG